MGIAVVEFNGLPGSGKTTIAETLIRDYKDKHYSVFTEEDVYGWLWGKSKKNKIINVFSFKNMAVNWTIIRVGMSESLHRKTLKPFLTSLNVVRYRNILDKFVRERKSGVVIMSEGLFQFASTIFDYGSINNQKLAKKMLSMLPVLDGDDYIFVNLVSTIELSEERLDKREKSNNTVDKLDGKKRVLLLKSREKNIIIMRKLMKSVVYDINTQDAIKDNVNAIKKIIDSKVLDER